MRIRVADDEQHPGWLAHVGWECYQRDHRLLVPPAARKPRKCLVEIPEPHSTVCPPRYALLLGHAVMQGEGYTRSPARVVKRVAFRCPEALRGSDLRDRICRGLALLARGVRPPPRPSVEKRAAVAGVYLTPKASEDLAVLGGNRSTWLRAAALIGVDNE